jgi:hypothetical protein
MALEDAVMKVVILAGGDGYAHQRGKHGPDQGTAMRDFRRISDEVEFPADLVGENDSGTIDEGSVLVFKPEPTS